MNYEKIFSKLEIRNVCLKNRIIFAPTSMGLRKKEYLKKLEDIARGGASLIILGDVAVRKSKFGPSLFSRSGKKYYQDIVDICHKYDALVSAELHQNDTVFKGMSKYFFKMISGKIDKMEVRRLMNEGTSDYISNLKLSEVKEITKSFGTAAKACESLGFDMVMVHGDRMVGSFSSSLFNKRTDEYGGSISNRMRFALEAVTSIRKECPNIPIDYKLAVRLEEPHYGNAGITVDEIKDFVPALEKAGVDSFHVTLANHGKLEDTIPPSNHEYFKGQGCFLSFSDEVKKYTTKPVVSTGGFSDPKFIEEQLEKGRIDAVGMSRQLIADSKWPLKVKINDLHDINFCVRCNKKCLGGMYEHKGVHCIYDKEEK